MLLAMAVIAFFWSAALPLVETLTFDHLREERGRYSGIRLWGSIGFIVAVLGTGAVLDVLPLNGLLWVCWGILAGILALAVVVPDVTAMPHPRDSLPVADILRQPRVRALLAACFAMSAAHGALYVFYSIHLANHGYSKSEVGGLWSLGVLAEIVVFMLMSRLSRRYSLRVLLLASFAAAILRFLLIGWGVESAAVMVLAQLLHGLTFGAYHASAIAAINLWFPGRAQGRGQALYSSISFGAGGLLGGLISGWSWGAIGAGWTYTLASVFAVGGFVLVWRWVREDAAVDAAGAAKTADPVP
jgi:PPP family 3-phenylpropionic acid transporter